MFRPSDHSSSLSTDGRFGVKIIVTLRWTIFIRKVIGRSHTQKIVIFKLKNQIFLKYKVSKFLYKLKSLEDNIISLN